MANTAAAAVQPPVLAAWRDRRSWWRGWARAPQWPAQCAICHAWPAEVVCTDCRARFAAPSRRCPRCAIALADGAPDGPCADCRCHPPEPLAACYAAVSYGFPWQRCIDTFKFHDQPGWADALGALMAAQPGIVQAVQAADALISLPLHRRRLAERGYNQALLLARALRREVARAHGSAPPVQAGWLLRQRETPPQSGLPRTERQRNLRGAFSVAERHRGALADRSVVLIDDVMTTGSSLCEAARTLQAAGCARVVAVVLARTEKS